ncbi:hypothetical protein D3C73_1433380 [compost metagenome]
MKVDDPAAREPCFDFAQAAVINNRAVIDDNQPFAEILDIPEIMGGQHDSGLPVLINLFDEFAYFLLHRHIEANGRFIQIHNWRVM